MFRLWWVGGLQHVADEDVLSSYVGCKALY